MALFIGFLTFVLVMNCLFLILLVLIQLPKKEAGAGIAFGGGATDALFGAGSGNALTNLSKYSASVFLCLALLLGFLNVRNSKRSARSVDELLAASPAKSAPATTVPSTTTAPLVPATNQVLKPATGTNAVLNIPAPANATAHPATNK